MTRLSPLRAAIGSLAAGQSIAVVATLGTTAVLARAMQPGDFGRFLTAWTFVTLAASLIKLGMSTSLQREIPLRQVAGDHEGAVGLMLASRRLIWLTSLLTVPVMAVLAHLIVPGVGLLSTATLLVLAATSAEAFRGVGETVLRGFGRPADSQKTGNPLRSVIFLLLSAGLWSLGGDRTLDEALWALLAANTISVLLQWLQTRSLASESGGGSLRGTTRHLAAMAPRFVLIDASGILLSQGDVLIAAQVLDVRQLAVYALAVRLAIFMLMPATVIGTAVAPQVSFHTGNRDYPRLMSVVRRVAVLTTAVTLAGTLAFAVVGRPGLRLIFGEQFTGAYVLVLILAIGAVLNAALQLSGWLLISLGHESVVFAVMAAIAVLQLLACFVLGRVYGSAGLAWASTVGTFAQSGLLAWIYWRTPHRKLDGASIPG